MVIVGRCAGVGGRSAPSPSALVANNVYSLVHGIAGIDSTVHPRHSRLVCALLAEHGKQPCLNPEKRAEYEAMEQSRQMLRACAKYRELAKCSDIRVPTMKKATLEETCGFSS